MPAERRMRAGLVGAGHMGQYHARVYAELWDVDFVGVVDVDLDRAAMESWARRRAAPPPSRR